MLTVGGLPNGFRTAARRRRSAVVLSAFLLLFPLTYFSLWTVSGQNLDNLAMEAAAISPVTALLHLDWLRGAVSLPGLVVASIAVTVAALLRRRPALALRALIVVGGVNLTAQLLKAVLSRPYLGVSFNLQNSYPSGHVAYAGAIAVALIMVAPRGWRFPAALAGWVWTALMGIMVVGAGWHRLADVLASLLIVAIWGFALAPAEIRQRVAPGLVGVALFLGALSTLLGIGLLGFASHAFSAEISTPLHQWQMLELITGNAAVRNALSAAVFLLTGGISGLILNGVDRLSGPN